MCCVVPNLTVPVILISGRTIFVVLYALDSFHSTVLSLLDSEIRHDYVGVEK